MARILSPQVREARPMPSFLSRLFGKSAGPAPEPILHKDCRIFPEPMKEAGGFRVAARIEKEVDGQVKTHPFIRSDVHASLESATDASVEKAKLAIDQLGDDLFR
jgi:hypothetical protein